MHAIAMGAVSGSSQNFFASDVASIATGADSAASAALDVPANAKKAAVQLLFTGNAAGSGNATAYIVGTLDGTIYETVGTTVVMSIASGARASNIVLLDVEAVRALKVLKVSNGDPAQAITAVNVRCVFY